MDNEIQFQNKVKRIKERYVHEAMYLVEQWRSLYQQTYIENGRQLKLTLDKAAEIVGVPRKTLEDYYYQLKKAETLVDLQNFKNCKIGVIRRIVKESKKQQETTTHLIDTNDFFLQENETNDYRKNSFEYDD
ncbi:unnamed protein product [Paramecium primaurelia]|uniref:Uncharacterized protein n=2 Tax=Paramecium TaxID=5884 RepID=A0A8S1TU97_9CILI|nr:unnamed protein product [Paramecium primaurelia]CAD8157371.1 unnamed protein product [Paramecium pentaurelia]